MMGKKMMAGNAWGRSGLASAWLRLGLDKPSRLVILAYHRVLDVGDEDAFAGDPELISASVEGFRQQMQFVRKHFEPLRMADVVSALRQGGALPRRALLVTFDDGHADNYTHAFPILRSLGIPATIFLSTGCIDDPRQSFWFDHVAELFFFAPVGELHLEAAGYRARLSDVASRRHATQELLRMLKREPDARRLAALREIEERLAHHVPSPPSDRQRALTWAQVGEMAAAGIEFGSHSVTHPVLARLDDVAIGHELADSRDSIVRHTGQPVDAVAYPVGKSDAYDDRVVLAAKACGYRVGLSYESGINAWPTTDAFRLRRLAVERYMGLGLFKAVLSVPHLFAH